MGILLAPFRKLGEWVIIILVNYLYGRIKDAIVEYKEKRERERIARENLKKYEEAVKNGLPREEQIKRAEDLLNGISNPDNH